MENKNLLYKSQSGVEFFKCDCGKPKCNTIRIESPLNYYSVIDVSDIEAVAEYYTQKQVSEIIGQDMPVQGAKTDSENGRMPEYEAEDKDYTATKARISLIHGDMIEALGKINNVPDFVFLNNYRDVISSICKAITELLPYNEYLDAAAIIWAASNTINKIQDEYKRLIPKNKVIE